ncbi:MAG: universal stress protein [Desulfobacterales bacterium]
MKNVMKVLVSIDGSVQSLAAVRYIGGVLKPEKTKVVLFHVDPAVPESFWDLEKSPEFRSRLAPVRAWAAQQKKSIEDTMTKAAKTLSNSGFPSDAVSVKIQTRKIGIARDILHEADTGKYKMVVVGRTGISKFKDLVLGSVANKLIGNLIDIPLVVVGGKPNPNKFIIAFDGSKASMRSVSTAGTMLNNVENEIMICHVIRSIGVEQLTLGEFPFPAELNWTEKCVKKIEPAIEEAKRKLVSAGLDSANIYGRILTEKPSRAGTIIAEAKAGGFGTIIVGRRGLSAVEEFFVGRVSRKVLHMAKKMAVWVVN